MTVHAAKGLEFPHVTVVGMEDGLMPLRFGGGFQSAEDVAEERRLAYVAITRAEKTLCLTRARRRYMYGMLNENAESEFLTEIKAGVALDVSESGLSTSGAGQHNWGQNSYGGGYGNRGGYGQRGQNRRGGGGWSGQQR